MQMTRLPTLDHGNRRQAVKVDPRRFTVDDPRYEVCATTGCWIWLGTLNAAGYGVVRVGHKNRMLAHRAFYEAFVGPIPADRALDHLCRTRPCVNPDHTRPCTRAENLLALGSQSPAMLNARKTHCAKGHPLVVRGNGTRGRYCKTCNQAQQRAAYAAKAN